MIMIVVIVIVVMVSVVLEESAIFPALAVAKIEQVFKKVHFENSPFRLFICVTVNPNS
jgi:hypothetical protein